MIQTGYSQSIDDEILGHSECAAVHEGCIYYDGITAHTLCVVSVESTFYNENDVYREFLYLPDCLQVNILGVI